MNTLQYKIKTHCVHFCLLTRALNSSGFFICTRSTSNTLTPNVIINSIIVLGVSGVHPTPPRHHLQYDLTGVEVVFKWCRGGVEKPKSGVGVVSGWCSFLT
jgi:hypothetical protein